MDTRVMQSFSRQPTQRVCTCGAQNTRTRKSTSLLPFLHSHFASRRRKRQTQTPNANAKFATTHARRRTSKLVTHRGRFHPLNNSFVRRCFCFTLCVGSEPSVGCVARDWCESTAVRCRKVFGGAVLRKVQRRIVLSQPTHIRVGQNLRKPVQMRCDCAAARPNARVQRVQEVLGLERAARRPV